MLGWVGRGMLSMLKGNGIMGGQGWKATDLLFSQWGIY